MNRGGDAFGVAEPELIDRDLSVADIGDEEEAEPAPSARRKSEKSWIEQNLWLVGIGMVLFFVVVGVAAFAVQGKTGGGRPAQLPPEVQAQAAAAAAVADARVSAQTQAEIDAIQLKLKQLQGQMADVLQKMEKAGGGTQDVQALYQRTEELRRDVDGTNANLKTLAKRVTDQQSFELEMYLRDDAEIVSIGNGLARLRDRNGAERTLRKGDKWNGLSVISIRSDRRQVTLSDGSVFQ